MFDIGGTELLVVAIVAIVVVGPKDLPRMLRTVGQFVGKAKTMAREFQNHFNEAMEEAGLDEVRKGVSDATSGRGFGDALKPFTDAGNEIKREIEKPVPQQAEASKPKDGDKPDDGPAREPERVAAPETTAGDAKSASS